MYTTKNFKTKKALKEAVQTYNDWTKTKEGPAPLFVRVFQPNDMFGKDYSNFSGVTTCEGPHFPEPHKWYARVTVKDGVVVKVT